MARRQRHTTQSGRPRPQEQSCLQLIRWDCDPAARLALPLYDCTTSSPLTGQRSREIKKVCPFSKTLQSLTLRRLGDAIEPLLFESPTDLMVYFTFLVDLTSPNPHSSLPASRPRVRSGRLPQREREREGPHWCQRQTRVTGTRGASKGGGDLSP